MIVAFKIIIDKDKYTSALIYKTNELNEFFEEVMNLLELTFPKARIKSKSDHYHIAGVSNAGILTIIKSIIEEVYIRFLDEEDTDDLDFDPTYFFL